jgi:hypothetical protein
MYVTCEKITRATRDSTMSHSMPLTASVRTKSVFLQRPRADRYGFGAFDHFVDRPVVVLGPGGHSTRPGRVVSGQARWLSRQEFSCPIVADALCPCRPRYHITGPRKIPAALICQPVCVAPKPDIAAIKAIIAVIVYHTRNVIGHSDVIVVDNDVVQLVRSISGWIVTSPLLKEHDRIVLPINMFP